MLHRTLRTAGPGSNPAVTMETACSGNVWAPYHKLDHPKLKPSPAMRCAGHYGPCRRRMSSKRRETSDRSISECNLLCLIDVPCSIRKRVLSVVSRCTCVGQHQWYGRSVCKHRIEIYAHLGKSVNVPKTVQTGYDTCLNRRGI